METPESASGPTRLILLPGLFLCVFSASAMILTRVVPGPLKELDYMVIGTISVMIGLLVLFLMIIRSAKSGDLFFKRREVVRPRAHSTSILDLGT